MGNGSFKVLIFALSAYNSQSINVTYLIHIKKIICPADGIGKQGTLTSISFLLLVYMILCRKNMISIFNHRDQQFSKKVIITINFPGFYL